MCNTQELTEQGSQKNHLNIQGQSKAMSCCSAPLLCSHIKPLTEFFLTGSKQCGKDKTAQPKAQSWPVVCFWKYQLQGLPEQNLCL